MEIISFFFLFGFSRTQLAFLERPLGHETLCILCGVRFYLMIIIYHFAAVFMSDINVIHLKKMYLFKRQTDAERRDRDRKRKKREKKDLPTTS